jgi:hypothetical protein
VDKNIEQMNKDAEWWKRMNRKTGEQGIGAIKGSSKGYCRLPAAVYQNKAE